MALANFPNGITSFGIPVIGGWGYPLRVPGIVSGVLGKVYFVDRDTGNDGSDGLSPDKAFATIQRAINLAVSGRGDQILVQNSQSDYAENLVIDKNDISIIGESASADRVSVAPLAGAPLINNIGHRLVLANLQLRSKDAGVVAGCTQRANRYRFVNCDFNSDHGPGLRLLPGNTDSSDHYTASEGIIEQCLFRYCSTNGLTFENPGVGGGGFGGVGTTGVVVRGCAFSGNANEDIKDVDTGGSNDKCFGSDGGDENLITDCRFLSRNKAIYITLTNGGSNTGLISNSFFAEDVSLTAVKIALASAIVFAGNYDAVGIVNGS